jgi:hypothetical protein
VHLRQYEALALVVDVDVDLRAEALVHLPPEREVPVIEERLRHIAGEVAQEEDVVIDREAVALARPPVVDQPHAVSPGAALRGDRAARLR